MSTCRFCAARKKTRGEYECNHRFAVSSKIYHCLHCLWKTGMALLFGSGLDMTNVVSVLQSIADPHEEGTEILQRSVLPNNGTGQILVPGDLTIHMYYHDVRATTIPQVTAKAFGPSRHYRIYPQRKTPQSWRKGIDYISLFLSHFGRCFSRTRHGPSSLGGYTW